MEECGYMMRGGSIFDTGIIMAPSSTKNGAKARDPEMESTKKGNQYYFGFKTHIGVDAGSGYVHTMKVTPANVHDITVASGLLRPDDKASQENGLFMMMPITNIFPGTVNAAVTGWKKRRLRAMG